MTNLELMFLQLHFIGTLWVIVASRVISWGRSVCLNVGWQNICSDIYNYYGGGLIHSFLPHPAP